MAGRMRLSLEGLLGEAYVSAVAYANAVLTGVPAEETMALARREVEFWPEEIARRQDALLPSVGTRVSAPLSDSPDGAGTCAFGEALHKTMSPLAAFGIFRVGEDGRLYLTGKSEHYQASLGHHFPGYRLLEYASSLGVTNITHNNTRGYITRMMERELVRIANGLAPGDSEGLERVLSSRTPGVLNRVVNLQTGSLVMEAALKMMLARFYRLHRDGVVPKYYGKQPVFLVMGDYNGGMQANYHGTTVTAQMLRGMWPELRMRSGMGHCFGVRRVAINDIEDFRQAVAECGRGECRPAGFLMELVLMNYGGIRLEASFVRQACELCREHDIPVAIDEIQTGIWSPELFMFREYGVKPSFAAVGKGFPGGMYPASRLICSAEMDNLDQFGALVTNGQEELASLAYLITMRFAEANAANTCALGHRFHEGLLCLERRHPELIKGIEGAGLLGAVRFADAGRASFFAELMNRTHGIDMSVQTYKADCPPTVLMKLPLIVSPAAVDFILEKMECVVAAFEKSGEGESK